MLLKSETAAVPRRVKDAEAAAAMEAETEELLQVMYATWYGMIYYRYRC